MFKNYRLKKQNHIDELKKECKTRNDGELWKKGETAENYYKLYKERWIVRKFDGFWDEPPRPKGGYMIIESKFPDAKCGLTELYCSEYGDCRTCQEPINRAIRENL